MHGQKTTVIILLEFRGVEGLDVDGGMCYRGVGLMVQAKKRGGGYLGR